MKDEVVGMWSVFLLMFGFFAGACVSIWVSGFLVAFVFPVFNYKDEFIEYYTKRTGAPPSRAKLIRCMYGAGHWFFVTEKSYRPRTPHSLSLIPTAFLLRHMLFGLASMLTALGLWAVILIGYQILKGLF
ncbi:MAG: hypothetical protein RID11_19030 [Roseovarius sp.]|uniref:hypothetical protein n=1 Tax=Roseovarius sp. TaxID=1486281 RepID=UPI0032EC361C